MEIHELVPGKCYRILYEKKIPIEFKFIRKDDKGKYVCQSQSGKNFLFPGDEQYLSIQEMYPGW